MNAAIGPRNGASSTTASDGGGEVRRWRIPLILELAGLVFGVLASSASASLRYFRSGQGPRSRTSNSIMSTPERPAASKDSIVFAGAIALAPPCPISIVIVAASRLTYLHADASARVPPRPSPAVGS
jgi:hypothetical protein